MNKTIQLYIFGITSFNSDIFDKFCTGKTEVDNIYNSLLPLIDLDYILSLAFREID